MLDIPYESSAGSYIDFARVLRRLSSAPAADLEALFRRMVFNLLIDNSDDQLKNHGMLHMGKAGYRLSPAFDVVPQLSNRGYQMLSIDGKTQESSLALALEVAGHFDLTADQAREIIRAMAEVVYGPWWEKAAVPEGTRLRLESCLKRQREVVGGGGVLIEPPVGARCSSVEGTV